MSDNRVRKIILGREIKIYPSPSFAKLVKKWIRQTADYLYEAKSSLRPRVLALFFVYTASIVTLGIIVGILLQRGGLPKKLLLSVRSVTPKIALAGAQAASWRSINTNLHV